MIISCPLCNCNSNLSYKLNKKKIERSLSNYFKDSVPENLDIQSFKIYKCNNCTLEFVHPMTGGSNSFYSWITGHAEYYPEQRWEYSIVENRINNYNKDITILDVGCGSGLFLERFLSKKNIKCLGIDTTNESVELCKNKGIDSICSPIENLKSYISEGTKFDIITLFHVLEHVSNPLEFIKEIVKYLKPNGELYISTPNSPMYFEESWFDVLNNPPHHATRWKLKAYQELSKCIGLEIDFKYSPPTKLLMRIKNVASLIVHRNNNYKMAFIRWIELFLLILPLTIKQSVLSKSQASSIILVRLKRSNNEN